MPLVKKMAAVDELVTVELGGDEYKVWYAPSKVTYNTINSEDNVPVTLAKIITRWDLTTETENDEGTAEVQYPITEDAIKELPSKFVLAVLRAIMRDQSPNDKQSENTGSFG